MSKTTYPGIDYSGPGATCNRDPETGIRYGVISQNSLPGEAVDDIFFGPHSKDLAWEAAIEDMKQQVMRCKEEDSYEERKTALKKVLKYIVSERNLNDRIEEIIEHFNDETFGDDTTISKVWDVIEQDFSDRSGDHECDPLYEAHGYRITKCLSNDLFVSKSPFFTYAQFCSPCVPGACNLDSPLEDPSDQLKWPDSNKCYCLGIDWFSEESPCPYPIWDVATGKRVHPLSIVLYPQ